MAVCVYRQANCPPSRQPLLPCPAVKPERSLGRTAKAETPARENPDKVGKKVAEFGVFAPRLPCPPSRLGEAGTPSRRSWPSSPAPAPEPESGALAQREKQAHRQLPTPLRGTGFACHGVKSVACEHVRWVKDAGQALRGSPRPRPARVGCAVFRTGVQTPEDDASRRTTDVQKAIAEAERDGGKSPEPA